MIVESEASGAVKGFGLHAAFAGLLARVWSFGGAVCAAGDESFDYASDRDAGWERLGSGGHVREIRQGLISRPFLSVFCDG